MRRASSLAALLLSIGCGGGGGGPDPTPRDTDPPQVVSSSPSAGGYVEDLASPIQIIFSEPLDAATVGASSIVVAANGSPVPGTPGCAGGVVTFIPAAGWQPGWQYTVSVTAAVRDPAGNAAMPWSITIATREVSAYRPALVVALWPAEGSADASPEAVVGVVFRESIDSATVTSSTFGVSRDGVQIPGLLSVSGQTVEFTPALPLEHGAAYKATLGTGIRALSGAALAKEFSWEFTVRGIAGAAAIVSANAYPAIQPEIAADGAGDLVVAWLQSNGTSTIYGVHYDVYAARRSAEGTWSAPVMLDDVTLGAKGAAQYLQLACATTGACLALWQRYDPGFTWESGVWAATYLPASGWMTPVLLDGGPANLGPVVLAASPDLTAIAMWPSLDGVLAARRFTLAGGWETQAVVEAQGATMRPALAMNATGDTVAVWATSGHNPSVNVYDVYAARFEPGAGWTVPEPIEDDVESAYYYPAVAVDPDGVALAVWSQGELTRWNRCLPGAGWGTAASLAATSASMYGLAAGPTGALLVYRASTEDGSRTAWYAPASSWSTVALAPFQIPHFTVPAIALSPAGERAVAWAGAPLGGSPTSYAYVWLARGPAGASWEAPRAVGALGTMTLPGSGDVRLARAGTGELAVVWSDGLRVYASSVR